MATAQLNDKIKFALDVRDRHASAAWYAEHLGFDMLFHADDVGWTELSTRTPGVTPGLGDNGDPKPGNALAVFGVDDIDAARSALEAAGVRFDGETMTYDGMVRLATFCDPDNNAMMLAQDLSS